MKPTTPKLSIAEQIQRESKLRASRVDEMPLEVSKSKVLYNEDALLVHPDRVFSNPKNSRKTWDAKLEAKINDMAETMKREGIGVIQPVTVRERKNSPQGLTQYEDIAGDCRLAAIRKAGLQLMPIIVKNVDDRTARRINLIENLHRSDLTDSDMGDAFVELKSDMQLEMEEFLEKAEMILPSDTGMRLNPVRWEQIKGNAKELDQIPTWMQGVIERTLEMQAKGNNRKPKVRWDDVAPEVGFSQVRSIHYYIATSKLAGDEDEDETEETPGTRNASESAAGNNQDSDALTPDETENALEQQAEKQIRTEVSEAIRSGELSQQQARALPSLSLFQQKILLDAIRKEKLSGPDAQKRSQLLRGNTGGSAGSGTGKAPGTRQSGHPTKRASAMSQLSDLSLPSEQIRAAQEVGADLKKLRAAVQGRFINYDAYDAHSKMVMRAQLRDMKRELEALESFVAPSGAAERAHDQERQQEEETKSGPGDTSLRLVKLG